MICFECGRPENFDGWAGLGRIVRDCDHCVRPVCSECAETDYDFRGDPGQYICCQWTCSICINPAAHIAKDGADYEAACMLQCLAEQGVNAYSVAVLSNAARHLAESENL